MISNLLSSAIALQARLRKPRVKSFFYLVIATIVFALILLNRSPNPLRSISLSLRTGLNLTVVFCFICLYIAFRLRGWKGQLFSLVATLALFAFPLAGLWAIGQTQSTIFTGIVPLFDASDYYVDALRLLAGQDFSAFSARRPLFPGVLSVVLWATNRNLMSALSIFTLVTAIACYVATREIQRTHGTEMAVFVLITLFLFYRHHSGSVMSENLGLPLGTLGFAMLWRGTSDKRMIVVTVGLFLLTLALNARAGTFFVLPLLLVWGGRVFANDNQKFSWAFMLTGSIAIIAGFIINLMMVQLLATPSGVPFANFSYSLYGLASGGKSWIYVFESHPELSQLQEPYQSRAIYRMAFELILDNPMLFLKGAFVNWSALFSNSWYSAYSYVSGENLIVGRIAQWIVFLFCALGFVKWFREPRHPLISLVGIAAVGVLISVPFLPPTDAYRMRPYAASMIVFGLLPALGLLFGMEILKIRLSDKPDPEDIHPDMMYFIAMLVVVSTIVGPVIVKNMGRVPQFQLASCDPDMDLVSLHFNSGTHFNIIRQSEPGLDWMPNFHLGRFKRNAHSLPDPRMIEWAESTPPRTSMFYTLDFQSAEKVLMIAPTNILPAHDILWQVCGNWETDENLKVYNIFYAQMAVKLP